MKTDKPKQKKTLPTSSLWSLIEQFCLQNGWSLCQFSREAGISRATLYQWQESSDCKPRKSTLFKLADVLNISPQHLQAEIDGLPVENIEPVHQTRYAPSGSLSVLHSLFEQNPTYDSLTKQFDRQSNWIVQEVCEQSPELFADWSEEEWDELFSSFGVGGELNEHGVRVQADAINKKRNTIYQLQVVLETHLADAARNIIHSLYETVKCNDVAELTAEPDRSEQRTIRSS